MKQTVSLKLMMGVLLFLLCLTVGCTNIGDDVVTAFPENAPTVRAAVNKAGQMLQMGTDIDVILTAIEDQLTADPRVYDVEVESEIGSVSMVFNDGETHTIRLTDEEQGTAEYSSSANDLADNLQITTQTSAGAEVLPLQQQAAGQGYYRMPANNKALLVNGYVLYHGKNDENKSKKVTLVDSTEKIEVMLKARGYDVERPEGTIKINGKDVTIPIIPVEVFKTLTDYGVILIETHGGRRYLENLVEQDEKPNCGGGFSQFKFLTTEPFVMPKDDDEKKKLMDDIVCGRLSIHNWIIKPEGKKPILVGSFFEVTPNYIRQHDTGKFPDNTLMILNICSADKSETGSPSPMKDMLFEKSNKGARFLGWNGETRVAAMGRASLNLFQLMTASNEELTVKGFEFLEKSTPPQGGEFTALQRALDELKKKSYLTDPAIKKKKETELKLTSQDGEDSDLILMPHPLNLSHDGVENLWQLNIYCDSQPTATVGETEVSLEHIAGSGWKISMPVGAYGDIVIRENGRISIPRPLHRWRPQIKIDTTLIVSPFPFLHLNATVTLLARATIDSWCFRDSIWNDPPPATFTTDWDIDGSNIAWKIDGSGTQTYDLYSMFYQYTGSGLESFRAAECSGSFYSFNGSTASFHICCSKLPFTMTFKGSDGAGGQDKPDLGFCATIWDDNIIALSDDWTVAKGTYQDNNSGVDPVQISWNAFPAEPPFDMDNEPR